MSDLGALSTEDLVNELFTRCDTLVIAYIKKDFQGQVPITDVTTYDMVKTSGLVTFLNDRVNFLRGKLIAGI
jgi:hypothetical protein